MNPYAASLRRFYIAQALYNMMLFLPTWVIFLQERHGLSLTQVTIIDIAFWLTMAFTEVPTGAVADTFGRKQSLLVGIALSALSVTMFGWAPNYLLLLVANSLWGVAITFMSGADMAFFYDTLRAQGRELDYPRQRGRLSAVILAGGAMGNIAGGFLASWKLGSTFWLYGLLLGIAFMFALGMKEPPRRLHPETGRPHSYVDILRLAWNAIRGQRRLQLSLLFSNVLPLASMLVTTIFIQPQMQHIGVPLAWMGSVLFALSLLRILASGSAGWAARLGGRWLWATPWMVALGLAGMALVPNLLGVALFGLAIFASVSSRPLIENLILRDAPEAAQATILSADNLVFRFFLAIVEPVGGILADSFGLSTAFLVLAAAIVMAMVLLLFLWRPDLSHIE